MPTLQEQVHQWMQYIFTEKALPTFVVDNDRVNANFIRASTPNDAIYIYILIWSIDFVFVSLFLSISTSFLAKKYMILSFEKYFLVFGCVLENTIENKFFTCCSHFLKFSQLPNKYIISFLNTETQKKQNPEKKIHQIRSNWEKKEERSAGCCDRRGAAIFAWSARCDWLGLWSLD